MWLGLIAALAAGVVLRLVVMQPVGLWTDECVTYWTASPASWLDVCRRSLGYTTHTPPFYLVVHASLGLLGANELAMRLPSLVAGMLAPLAAFFALRTLSRRNDVAWLGALLAAVQPHQIAVSEIARPYAMAAVLTYLSVWVFALVLQRPSVRRWLAWAVVQAGLIHCNYLFVLVPVTQTLVYLLSSRADGRPLRPLGAGVGALVVLMAPFAPHAVRLMGRGPTLIFRDAPTARELLPGWFDIVLGVWLAAMLASVAVSFVRRREPGGGRDEPGLGPRTGLVVLSWYALPMAALYLLGQLTWMRVFHPRYLTAFLVALPAVAGWLFALVPGRRVRVLAIAVLLVLMGAARWEHFEQWEMRWAHEDWRRPVQAVCEAAGPGDVVVFNAGLVEARQVHERQDDGLYNSYLQAPLSGIYGRPDAPVVNLGHRLHPDAPRTRYMDEVVLPRLRQARRVWLLVRDWRGRRLLPDLLDWLSRADGGRFRIGPGRRFMGSVLTPAVNTRPGGDVGGRQAVEED